MLPKNSKELYKKVSAETNEDFDLVKDFLDFAYSELRRKLSSLEKISYTVKGLGVFFTGKKQISKEYEKILNYRMSCKSIEGKKQYSKDLTKLDGLIDQLNEETKRREQAKENKLKWHKDNGDPYGIYKKTLETNS